MNGFIVVTEQVTPGECFRTDGTGKGTLSSVNAVVPLQILGPGKAAGTLGACRWFDARVRGDVLPEIVACREFDRA